MLNRTSAPAFSKTFSFELPQPEIIHLNDGIDLVFLNGIQQDVAKIEVIFQAGKWWEKKTGLSHFTAIMLDKGTSHKSAKEIAEALDYYGAQIEISPGYDFVALSLYVLRKHFDKIFPLFWEIITEPSFPEDELSLQKEIFLQNLKINNEKNSFVASKLIRKNIFGANHPYGSSIEEVNVSDITRQELAGFFANNFFPREIYLMGKFDQSDLHSLQKQLAFKTQSRPENSFNVVTGMLVEKVVKENSIQSSIRLGKRTINRNHQDYFSLLLLNHVLGGFFGSRLMKNIREEKGLTYGIYSSLNPHKNDCTFSIGADVGKEKKELALSEIKLELQKLSTEKISPEELSTAKNHFFGSLQLEIANPFAALDKIKNIRLNDLTENYYSNLFSSILLVNPVSLQLTAAKYFSTKDLLEVSVG